MAIHMAIKPTANSADSCLARRRRAGWFTTSALKQALAKGGCVLCQALSASVHQYVFSFLYEGMMSGDVRMRFLQGGGFCAQHFLLAKLVEEESWSDGFGVSILCENLLERLLKDLESITGRSNGHHRRLLRSRSGKSVANWVAGKDCMVCVMAGETAARYLEALEELLSEPDFETLYRRSGGLCLGHLHAAAEAWTSIVAISLAREVAQSHVQGLIGELREFQRKHDYQHKQEPRGDEWTSPWRSMEFLTSLSVQQAGAYLVEKRMPQTLPRDLQDGRQARRG